MVPPERLAYISIAEPTVKKAGVQRAESSCWRLQTESAFWRLNAYDLGEFPGARKAIGEGCSRGPASQIKGTIAASFWPQVPLSNDNNNDSKMAACYTVAFPMVTN